MNKEIVKSERLGESYSVFHHPSGLDVLVWKMEGFTTTEAIFATKYGSIYNCFKTKDSKDFITVPEGIQHCLHLLYKPYKMGEVCSDYQYLRCQNDFSIRR